jgi:tRNA dimethylallyltransferase
MTKYLISIVGPTAIGKTALSIKLANHYNTEIISADSRQFFKEMSIGTAAPTLLEQSLAKHHFIHHKSINDDYNVGMFEKEAISKLNELYKTHQIIIMVGGSGLYVDAVTKGLDSFPEIDGKIRQQLNNQYKNEGLKPLLEKLKDLDKLSYNTIAIDNPHRVIRALEVCIGSGKPYSSFLNNAKGDRNFKTISIGLTANRELIYERINKRVDMMVEEGLIEEVTALKNKQHLNALNTVGYKEIFKYLDNEWPLDFAISEIKKNTRRFAKRQLTWFKKDEAIFWFNYEVTIDEILNYINEHLKD